MRTPHGGDQLVGAKRYFPPKVVPEVVQVNTRFCQSKKKEEKRGGINFLKFRGNDQIILMIVKILLDK